MFSKMDTKDTTYEVSPKSALLTGQYDVKQNHSDPIKLSRARTVLLLLVCGTAYIVWGALISLQPSFYPTEAELKGATPSQVTEKYLGLQLGYQSLTLRSEFSHSMDLYLVSPIWLLLCQPRCLVHMVANLEQNTSTILEHLFKLSVPSALGSSSTLTTLRLSLAFHTF